MNQPLHLSARQSAGLSLPPVQPPARPAPYLRPGLGAAPPMAPYPGEGSYLGVNAERVISVGGALASLIVNPSITPFEQLYRRLPEAGMFLDDVSPDSPFVFELGAFQVPSQFALLLFDLRPDIYRFSGVDAGDTVPVEARRFSSMLGFELTVDQQHPGNLLFQLDPQPIDSFPPAATAAAGLPPGLAAALAAAQSNSFAASAGAGTSLMPQRPTRYGPLSVPFTLYVKSNQTVQVRCVVFQSLTSPIAFIEYDIAGMLIPESYVNSLNAAMAPVTNASGGPGSLGPGGR